MEQILPLRVEIVGLRSYEAVDFVELDVAS